MPRPVRRPSGTFRLSCLGPGRLTAPDGRHVPLRTRKHLALLFILAQRAGRHIPRERVIELLWSEDGERAARHSLSQAVSLINKAAGEDLVVAEGATQLVVTRDALRTDVAEFEALAKEGRYDEARALWHGTLFDGLYLRRAPAFERWLTEERGRLERQMRRMATDLIERRRQDGDHAGMRAEAEALLALDPLDETAMLACVQALTLAGERTLALRRYGEFEKRLKAELDAEPGSALRGWAKRIRRGEAEVVRASVVSRVHEVQALPAAQPLFGRVEEYRALWETWEQATAGTGTFWIIQGEPGIGKTALAGKLANQVHVSGASVCFVSCYRTEKSVPFAPISALIRQLARLPGFVAMSPSWIGELTRLVPELKERFPNAPPPMGVDDSARFRLCDATVQATECVADEQPLLIVVDDVHDADEATLATLHYLGRQVKGWPALVVATTRMPPAQDHQVAGFLHDVERGSMARVLTLARLSDEVIGRIAAQELARGGLKAEHHVGVVVPEARGNPLFTIEACAAISRATRLPQRRRGVDADDFNATVLARLSALAGEAKSLAECLALAGRPLAEHELAAVLGLGPAVLSEALMHLRDADFLQQSGSRIALVHEEYAATISAVIEPSRRRNLHEKLAQFFERDALSDPGTRFQVATHLVAAERPSDARRHALAAASFAASLGAVREQAAALEVALEASEDFDAGIALQLAECYLELGDREAIERISTRAEQAPGCPLIAQLSLTYLRTSCQLSFGRLSLPEALRQLTELLDQGVHFPHRAQALGLVVRLAYRLGDPGTAKHAARSLRKSHDEAAHPIVMELAAYIAAKLYDPRRALRYLRSALLVAEAKRDYSLEHYCRAGLGAVLRQLGRFVESEAELVRGLALARRTLNRHAEAARLSDIACARMGLGDFEGAERHLLESASIVRGSAPAFLYHLTANLAEVALLLGQYSVAAGRYECALGEARKFGAWSLQLLAVSGLTLCAQRQGDTGPLLEWGAMAKQLARGRELYLHDRWTVDAALAWHALATGADVEAVVNQMEESGRDLRRRDVDHWLFARAERMRLELVATGTVSTPELRSLREVATQLNAGGVLRLLQDLQCNQA